MPISKKPRSKSMPLNLSFSEMGSTLRPCCQGKAGKDVRAPWSELLPVIRSKSALSVQFPVNFPPMDEHRAAREVAKMVNLWCP